METFKNLDLYSSKKPLALSIGMFDGVHKGHQFIISHLNKVAESLNLESAIFTFWPHPRTFFDPDCDLKLLNTIEEKGNLLQENRIQNLFLQKFDEDFRNLSGEEFVRKILVEKLNVKYLIIGYDHTFGKDKSGDFKLLQKLAPELGFEFSQLPAVDFHHKHISSTQIRNALSTGNILEANEMLGYKYSLSGKVVDGKKLGRTIGYPTANLEVDDIKLLPKNGAYIVEVFHENKFYKGMLSIGTNPTVNGETKTVEVYILDFNLTIYGETLTLKFRDFLHEEIKFESLEKLIERLDEDKILMEKFEF
ncbi:bifunctional riboflavin kinase/FAD synthetase [Halpernia frigidisoli]|uniref:Riboflavin biosynthesis protein n=1 Tax=Halpernia frigidisoli TaxID=1125876 RepID=A0A1I3DAZ7_9FLAO|nr:bifunctional riboflavin kinase/FAD synthetase [Halpernia frigidisoli]SFH83922.1 riboflavin kinase / FMN adenylyltransferase [Halpernia frigidisoli]